MPSQIIKNMSDKEVLAAMQSDTRLAKVRRLFHFGYAELEQAAAQRKPLSSIEQRRMELQIANDICALFDAGLK